ncbi:MAG: HD domain-containing phosphohydrolase [Myxococcota bacterium]
MSETTSAAQPETDILIVDDEQAVRRSLERILRSAGYHCAQASSVAEAIDFLEAHPVKLVLSDIRMPQRSGLELVDIVSELHPDTVIVTVTAVDTTAVAVDALSRGAYAYVIKPFDMNEILIQARYALRRRELEMEQLAREEELQTRVREQTHLLRRSREEIALRLISASQYRDTETGAHIRRIGLYTAFMAEVMGMDQEKVEMLRVAAPMHDVGKIGIPDAILLKAGSLDEDEWQTMKTHTTIGASILSGSKTPLMQLAETIALQHHERWNGRGYPSGLQREDIAIEARMVAVADVYDALTHDRVYKEAWPEDKAFQLIEDERGEHFDPDIAQLFLDHADNMHDIRVNNPVDSTEFGSQWQRSSGRHPSLAKMGISESS